MSANHENEKQKITTDRMVSEHERWKTLLSDMGTSFDNSISGFLAGNQTLKQSFIGIFGDIRSAFSKMIADMIVEQTKLSMIKGLTTLSGAGGWIGTAATFIKGFFADGGIVPGNYTQPAPIIAHGSEMVLNPLQQKNLWNLIAGASPSQNQNNATNNASSGQQAVHMYNITPVFQSLDPAQGQKMFTNWMKQGGIPLVKESIKNNNYQMRDLIKNV